MPVEFSRLENLLRRGPPAPTYLVSGEESVLVDEAARLIAEKVLEGRPLSDPSVARLEGQNVAAGEVEAQLRSGSLFGGRRLVVVREAQSLSSQAAQGLAEYAAAPLESATLLLVFRGVSAGTRDTKRARQASAARRLTQSVERGGGVVIECPRPRARDLPALARKELESRGLQVSGGGLQALLDAVGEEVGALRSAAEKLLLFLGPGQRVEPEHVAEVVCGSRTLSIFELTDAVGQRSEPRAMRALFGLLEQGEPPLAVLGQLVRHVRNLAQVAAASRRGEDAGTLQKRLGLHPYVVKKCQEQARRFSLAELLRLLGILDAADAPLKAGAVPAELQLERLVLQLVSARK